MNLLADRKAVDSTPKYSLLAGDKNQASIFSSGIRSEILFHICAYVYPLLGQTEGKRKTFFGRDREGWCKVRLPQIALSFFKRLKRFLFL